MIRRSSVLVLLLVQSGCATAAPGEERLAPVSDPDTPPQLIHCEPSTRTRPLAEVRLMVGADGTVLEVLRAQGSHQIAPDQRQAMERRAEGIARTCVFTPATKDGVPVPTLADIPVY